MTVNYSMKTLHKRFVGPNVIANMRQPVVYTVRPRINVLDADSFYGQDMEVPDRVARLGTPARRR